MVKIFFLALYLKNDDDDVKQLCYGASLTSFGFFQRNSILEFMSFMCKMAVKRMKSEFRQSVKHEQFVTHMYTIAGRLAGLMITDKDYPRRVAHTLISKILNEFIDTVPVTKWTMFPFQESWNEKLQTYLDNYQNPQQADLFLKLQAEINETQIILQNSLVDLLNRGEKLEDLVSKSEDLSIQSKLFYRRARQNNQCCKYY